MSKFDLGYPAKEGLQPLSLSEGNILFLVGANGSGKSTLMHNFSAKNFGRVRKITAHRQVWFNSNTIDLTPASRLQTGLHIASVDNQEQSRYKDDYAHQRSQATIFDLIDFENIEARNIAGAARSGDLDLVKSLAASQSPLQKMNDILRISNLHFRIEVEQGSALMAVRSGFPGFGISELSDGERNALLIIASVLTAPENTLILLDEPERHLHRSIVSPLISTLLAYRGDCAFVVSTHDVSLPLDQVACSALLIRSYSHSPRYWDADYVESFEGLDEKVALAILGSRKKILFIEGHSSSLDLQIYQILFPNISIKPVGSCIDVERAVRGLVAACENHWVSAFGLIDRDNRSDEECRKYIADGIFPLDQYSVESLYYHPQVVEWLLKRVSEVSGSDVCDVLSQLNSDFINVIDRHKDRLAAKMVERKIRDIILHQSPTWKQILERDVKVEFATADIFLLEKKLIEEFISDGAISSMVSRYPLRETEAFGLIAKALGFSSREKYEQAVRKLLIDSQEVRKFVADLISPLSKQLV